MLRNSKYVVYLYSDNNHIKIEIMTTLKITDANNKSLVGKKIYLNEETMICKLGRTDYKLQFSVHQPGIPQGNYKVIDHTLEDLAYFILYNINGNHGNKGVYIHKYEILN